MLMRARRPFTLGDDSIQAGQVVDLSGYDLPPGRAQRLVDQRYGDYVVEESVACEACGRSFGSEHALRIHTGKKHASSADDPIAVAPDDKE